MKGAKKYMQPKDQVMNAIHDLAELQKAKTLSCDSPRGTVLLRVTMYASEWEYRFDARDIGANMCEVTIGLAGETQDAKRLIGHEFALLDYALKDRARIDLEEIEGEAVGMA